MIASSLTRSLRERDLVAIAIGVIGAGIFGLPGKLYALVGPYSLLECIVCAVLVSLVALCFADVSSRFRDTGGPYLDATSAFGRIRRVGRLRVAVDPFAVWRAQAVAARRSGGPDSLRRRALPL